MKGSMINMLISLSFLFANKPWDHLLTRAVAKLKHCTQAHTLNKQHFGTKNIVSFMIVPVMYHFCPLPLSLSGKSALHWKTLFTHFEGHHSIWAFEAQKKYVAIWEDI